MDLLIFFLLLCLTDESLSVFSFRFTFGSSSFPSAVIVTVDSGNGAGDCNDSASSEIFNSFSFIKFRAKKEQLDYHKI